MLIPIYLYIHNFVKLINIFYLLAKLPVIMTKMSTQLAITLWTVMNLLKSEYWQFIKIQKPYIFTDFHQIDCVKYESYYTLLTISIIPKFFQNFHFLNPKTKIMYIQTIIFYFARISKVIFSVVRLCKIFFISFK